MPHVRDGEREEDEGRETFTYSTEETDDTAELQEYMRVNVFISVAVFICMCVHEGMYHYCINTHREYTLGNSEGKPLTSSNSCL